MNARQILASGVWYLPGRVQGAPDLQKPPAYYWAVASFASAGSLLARGFAEPADGAGAKEFAPPSLGGEVDAWAIRLPSLLAALIAAGVVALLGMELGFPWAGMVGSFVLLTTGHFAWGARIGRIDMPLAAAIATSAWLQLRLLRTQNSFDLTILGLVLAIGILFKGPIALAMAMATSMAVLAYGYLKVKKLSIFFLFQSSLTYLFALLVSLPWFLCAHGATDGEFTRLFFIEHNWDRGFGTGRLRSHPFYFYLPQFFADFLPWSPIGLGMAVFLYFSWKRMKWDNHPGFYAMIFCSAWFLAIFAMLSASQYKRADYLLPAYPAAALALGLCLTGFVGGWARPKWVGYRPGLILVGMLLGILGMVYLLDVQIPALEPNRDSKQWATEIQRRIPADEPLVFFAEEAHAVAFHLDRDHRVLGKPAEFARVFEENERVWVITNPEVLEIWPEGPPSVRWRIASKNGDLSKPVQHKPLILLEAFARPGSQLTKAKFHRGDEID